MATTAATNYIVTMTIRHCSDAVPTTYGVYSTREEAEASIPYHQTRYVRDMLLAELDCHAVTDESVSDIAQNFSMDPEDVRKLLTTDVVTLVREGFSVDLETDDKWEVIKVTNKY